VVYACRQSFYAIRANDKDAQRHWVIFWLILSLSELLWSVFDPVASYLIPFYGGFKCAFLIQLGLFEGATQIYTTLVPVLSKGDEAFKAYEPILAEKAEQLKGVVSKYFDKVPRAKAD